MAEKQIINPEDHLGLALKVASHFVKHIPVKDSEEYAEACIKLYEATKDYDPDKGPFSTWAYRKMKQGIISHYRKRTADVLFEELKERPQNIKEDFKGLLDMLLVDSPEESKIDRKNKKILIDHYMNGKTFAHIGRELGISRAAVQQKVKRSLLKIRQVLRNRG